MQNVDKAKVGKIIGIIVVAVIAIAQLFGINIPVAPVV